VFQPSSNRKAKTVLKVRSNNNESCAGKISFVFTAEFPFDVATRAALLMSDFSQPEIASS
jgi:hypothetical protein